MGLFDFFTSKSADTLNKDEKEAADILKKILQGFKNGNPDFIPNGIEKLSIGLYYLAFKRTKKSIVRLEDAMNPMAILDGNFKAMHYASVYSAIKETIEKTCNNPVILKSVFNATSIAVSQS